ncbi:MAG: DEAD/DEAH box helicase [Planctomycetes bacterium]|nr:DEAD/DEAH box helicase [Planctomycetota bacterium]
MSRAIRDVEDLVAALREDAGDVGTVDGHLRLPPREARFVPYPDWVLPALKDALQARGITSLYSHQREAAELLHAGRDVVVATSTASGKSVGYHLPVLDRLLREPSRARALYLFPTKALSRDQMAELERVLAGATAGGERLTVAVYDGDTPPDTRRALREGGHLVITNPHMLHAGILPNHTKWQGLFSGLEYVVVDEVHTLSGIYGSHVANVLRRLVRICAHYGSRPVFCAASATISNAAEHAQRLFERPVKLVDDDGSARGPKHFLFVNPQLVSEASGMRVPALDAARRLATNLVAAQPDGGIQSIFFVRSRSNVEVLLKYLRDECKAQKADPERVTGYRGGYLPNLRRDIERGLREGRITSVVSTNALELGIDIGSLDVCVLVGYPGTVSSTFQRAGRVGRRQRSSAVILLARSFAMDQFLVREPGFLFDAPREAVAIDPDNAVILANHVKCAAFELPFTRGDGFGKAEGIDDVLEFLSRDLGLLVREGDRYHFAAATFPAEGVSLNAAELDNVVIHDRDTGKVLGEIDRASSITEVYEGAIYGHQGEQYLVEEFRYDDRRCYVRRADVDYYTEADTETEVRVLHLDASEDFGSYCAHRCEVHVSTLAKAYKKLRFYTRENVGDGEIDLPPEEFETEACVLALDPELAVRAGLSEGANGGGLRGLAELIQGLVPLFVRVDPGDVRVSSELRHPHFERPTILIHDAIPNGVGLSERIFAVHREVLQAALGVVTRCRCAGGCPSCIGPARDQGRRGKALARRILEELLGGRSA